VHETNLHCLRQTWNTLAESDPLWAVLSWPAKRGQRWHVDEFFGTGETEIDGVMDYAGSLGLQPPWTKALDFGCGVGRTTQALGKRFEEVWGVDISPTMIELAMKLNQHGSRCHYIVNGDSNLDVFPDDSFRFVYSNIVLQHIRPEYSRAYIQEFVRVLEPGGFVVFQLPARRRRASSLVPLRRPAGLARRLVNRWRYRELPRMEMHCIEVDEVVSLLEGSGAQVLDVLRDEAGGPRWTSFRYCARKSGGWGPAREDRLTSI
jgi:ubiquinone/menaquinone biosynthesis C-methylase UbiE